jgi:HPt (histidine-containing phosphotransfer) domain-containing protein
VDSTLWKQFKNDDKSKEVPMEKKRKLSELEECFLNDAEEAINVLEGLYAKIDALGEEDLELYEVTVHGVKSALANIGETELSDVAYRLEQVALEKNLALLAEETPDFLTALKSFTEELGLL